MAFSTMSAPVCAVNPTLALSTVFVIQESDGAARLYDQDCIIYKANADWDLTLKLICSVRDGVSTVRIVYADDLTEADRLLALQTRV